MLPYIIGVAVVAAGTAAYQHFTKDNSTQRGRENTSAQPAANIMGSIVIWGRPNAGKTTFISQLLEKSVDPSHKVATTSQTKHTNIPIKTVDGKRYRIRDIIDMPGTKDRLNDWLTLVKTHEHVFYMVNLRRLDEADYQSAVRADLKATVAALQESSKTKKRIHIISSHVDQSKWKDIDPSDVSNRIQEDQQFRMQYEALEGVAGYVYAANLTDQASFQLLLESLVRDCNA